MVTRGKEKKKKTQRGTRRSGSPKVTEIQRLKLLCWSRENNICRLSARPIIPPHTHACVSDKKKKREKEKEKGSCNCSNVCKRTRNLDPIWHPSQHVFLSRALGSNVNRKKTASALCCEFFTQEGKEKSAHRRIHTQCVTLWLCGVFKWGTKSYFSYSVRLLPHWSTDSVVLDLPQRYLTNISS